MYKLLFIFLFIQTSCVLNSSSIEDIYIDNPDTSQEVYAAEGGEEVKPDSDNICGLQIPCQEESTPTIAQPCVDLNGRVYVDNCKRICAICSSFATGQKETSFCAPSLSPGTKCVPRCDLCNPLAN